MLFVAQKLTEGHELYPLVCSIFGKKNHHHYWKARIKDPHQHHFEAKPISRMEGSSRLECFLIHLHHLFIKKCYWKTKTSHPIYFVSLPVSSDLKG
jgi:hypothetical protein